MKTRMVTNNVLLNGDKTVFIDVQTELVYCRVECINAGYFIDMWTDRSHSAVQNVHYRK